VPQRLHHRSSISVFLGLLTASCGGPFQTRACHLIGCSSGYFRTSELNNDAHALEQLSVKICKNGQCLTGTLAPALGVGMGRAAWLGDHKVEVMVVTTPSGYRLHVSYYGGSGELHDGDRYDITASDQRGGELLATHETVHYFAHQPNGPNCPPICIVGGPWPKK
jgi:hypothetical protein